MPLSVSKNEDTGLYEPNSTAQGEREKVSLPLGKERQRVRRGEHLIGHTRLRGAHLSGRKVEESSRFWAINRIARHAADA